MHFIPSPLAGAYLIKPTQTADNRGWFSRIYCREEYAEIEPDLNWVQFNNSFTYKTGTIRGLHFQYEPFSEIKLVRCISGEIFDVIVDVRENSPTFLKWFSGVLSSQNRTMMYVPRGFAHGFQTLTDNCEIFYAHSYSYKAGHEGAIKYNDPAIAVEWPLPVSEISDRDRILPLITEAFKGTK